MKKIGLNIVILFVLVGCNGDVNVKESDYFIDDTLIMKNSHNLTLEFHEDKKSDTFIMNRLRGVIYKIDTLNIEIKRLKIQNYELKGGIDDTGGVGKPYVLLPISDDKKNW